MDLFTEFFNQYGMQLIYAILTAIIGYIGLKLKSVQENISNDKTKKSVVEVCCKAAEQLYHDLGGAEKLEKVKQAVSDMLEEKGIHITVLEMDMLIESVVAEFNYNFNGCGSTKKEEVPLVEESNEIIAKDEETEVE